MVLNAKLGMQRNCAAKGARHADEVESADEHRHSRCPAWSMRHAMRCIYRLAASLYFAASLLGIVTGLGIAAVAIQHRT